MPGNSVWFRRRSGPAGRRNVSRCPWLDFARGKRTRRAGRPSTKAVVPARLRERPRFGDKPPIPRFIAVEEIDFDPHGAVGVGMEEENARYACMDFGAGKSSSG